MVIGGNKFNTHIRVRLRYMNFGQGNSSSTTRRGFMTGLGSVAAASLSTVPATAQQTGDAAQYAIGLPIEKQWSFGFADSQGIGSPTVNPGTITEDVMYVSLGPTDYDPAKIVAVDRATHDRIWETTADTGVSTPAVAGDTLYVTLGSTVHAYPANEKPVEARWKQRTRFDDVFWPVLVDDSVCIAGYDIEDVETDRGKEYHYRTGGIALYAKDGSRKWLKTGEFMESPYVHEDSVIHLQGHQYKAGNAYHAETGRIVSRDKETGDVQWKTPDFGIYSLRISWAQDRLLALTPNDAIRGIDASSGDIQWTLQVPSGVEDYTLGPDHAYLGIGNSLRAIHPSTGEEVWTRSDFNPFDIFYDGGLVFVGTEDAQFYALDAATGETVWSDDLPRGNGYFRYVDGVLYTFAANWVGSYIGQLGIALQRLDAARSPTGLGSVTASAANLLGRGRALDRADTAIENNDYQAANQAITAAERRTTAVNAAAFLLTGSAAYSGGRVSMHEYRRRELESTLDEIQSTYPVEAGALEGLSPDSLVPQAEVAVESLGQTRWGRPLRDTVAGTDEYGQLGRQLKRYAALHDDIESTSEELATHREHIDVTAWRSAFDETFDGDVDDLQQTLDACQQALTLTAKHVSFKETTGTNEFDLTGIEALLEEIKSPATQPDASAINYCDTAFTTIDAYTSAKPGLSGYDLSNVHGIIQSALQTDTDHRATATGSLEDIQDLLDTAAATESARQSLDLNHSDITHEEITQWIQSALSEASVETINKVETAVNNLKAGIWKPKHLHEYTPTQFEHLVADLYADQGYRTTVTQQSNDAGIDVMAHGGSETIAIQVKQYSPGNRVGRPTVQQTAGVRSQIGATKAIIVTSSDFTQTAKDASRQYGGTIELINGTELTRRLSRSSLTPPTGVRSNRTKQHRHHRTRQSTSGGHQRQSRQAGFTGGGAFCMICGEHFQSDLEQIQTPDGETIRCCPRCKQLIEQTTNIQDHDQDDALCILGLSPGASQDEIKRAYRERVRDVHPDQGGSNDEFQQVQQAYETLID